MLAGDSSCVCEVGEAVQGHAWQRVQEGGLDAASINHERKHAKGQGFIGGGSINSSTCMEPNARIDNQGQNQDHFPHLAHVGLLLCHDAVVRV